MVNLALPNDLSIPGVYEYQHLPELARLILQDHLVEFCTEQLTYARAYNVPLLKVLSHFSDAELIELSLKAVTEQFGYLASNNAKEQIVTAIERWISNQLDIVGKHDVVAEDITLIFHVRGKSLKNFAFRLYRDHEKLHALLQEIDDFLLGSATTSANTYIQILKDQIQKGIDYNARLSDALPGFVYVYDVQQRQQIHSNEKLHDVLGYEKDEFQEISKDFFKSIMHPNDYDRSIECRKHFVENKSPICSFECRLKDNLGKYKWLRFYETSLKAQGDGESIEIIGVAFDISHEREMTDALALSEKQLLEAQSIAQIGSYEWDIKGLKTTTTTPEIHRIFEMEKFDKFEEFMTHVHKDDVQMVRDAITESFETGNYQCVYRYIRNNKEKIIWSQGVVVKVDGLPTTMVGTVQDVTLIKRMEAELREKASELEKSNERLQEFAAIASHDLKEPLRKISIFSHKILQAENEKLSESSSHALNKIVDGAVRMQKMIEEILEFSFITGAQEKEETDLEQLVIEVKDLLSESISEKNAVVTTDKLPKAFVNASQFKQVFQNLIANALKFSKPEEKPRINITHTFLAEHPTTDTETRQLIIRFEDNGIGFHEKDEDKIFGVFYRLHSKGDFEGSGLGLSICRKIMENHGGRISASSVPGKGSVFVLALPVS